MRRDAESEFELKIPDLLCHSWWLVLDTPFREMTREEFEAERVEMAPHVFETLNCCIRQEKLIIQKLKHPGLSKTDQKYLRSALASVRSCIGTVMKMITEWGLTGG